MAFDKETMQVIKKITIRIEEIKEEIKRLKEENEKLRECLGFYADHENWNTSSVFGSVFSDIDDADIESIKSYSFGGKLARKTLNELE